VWTRWEDLEAELPNLGAPWFFSPDGERSLWEIDLRPPSVLVFGKESTGLPPQLREARRDRLVRVPMRGAAIRSLNLSTIVGVALYEAARQRDGHQVR
jgi:tRNA (cytidine/uridine-2'-O-)-methyltransferase